MKRILVPTDFSPTGNKGLHYAQEWSNRHKTEMDLLHVVEKEEVETIPYAKAFPHEYGKFLLIEAKVRLKKIANLLLNQRTRTFFSSCFGKPDESIVDMAKHNGSDLIVLGYNNDRDGSQLSTHVLSIIHRAPCPVIVVQPEFESNGLERIVVPIRNTPFMLDKMRYIIPIATSVGASVHLVVFFSDTNDLLENQKVSNLFEQAREFLRNHTIPTTYTCHFKGGNYVRNTILEAKNKKADLIVIMANQSEFKNRWTGIADDEAFLRKSRIPLMTIPTFPINAINKG